MATATDHEALGNVPWHLGWRVLSAQLINELGSGVTTVAIPLLVYAETRSAVATSLVFIASAIPTIVFGVVGGAHADRVDRRRLVVSCTLAVAALLALLPVAYERFGLSAVVLIGLGTRTLLSFSDPAFTATLPKLFGESFQDFVGKRAGLGFVAQALGPALGGALVGLVGATNAIYVDAASYLVFAVIVGSIRHLDPDAPARRSRAGGTRTVDTLVAGLNHLRGNSAVAALFLYWFLSLTAVPISLLAAIPYITEQLDRSSFEYGLAVSCYAVASLVASFAAGKYRFRGGARRWLILSGFGYGVANLLMITEPGFVLFCALWFLWGLAYGPEEVVGQVAFAQVVPEEFHGRMYAVMNVVFALAGLVGAAVAGPVIDHVGASAAMVLAGVVFVVATTASFVAGPGARALSTVRLSGS